MPKRHIFLCPLDYRDVVGTRAAIKITGGSDDEFEPPSWWFL